MWPLGVTILATSCAIDNGSALKTSHKILAVRVANLEIIGHIVVLPVKICFSMRSLYFFLSEFDLCMIRLLSESNAQPQEGQNKQNQTGYRKGMTLRRNIDL